MWVLIITLQFSEGVAITTHEYLTEQRCLDAGAKAKEKVEGLFSAVRFSCSER